MKNIKAVSDGGCECHSRPAHVNDENSVMYTLSKPVRTISIWSIYFSLTLFMFTEQWDW